MSNSIHSNARTAPKPIPISKIVVGVFSLGVVFGTGLAHGYYQVIESTLPSSVADGKYSLLYLGMSPTDARSILGPGTEISQSVSRVAIKWSISETHIITAVFENGKLIEKTQKDL